MLAVDELAVPLPSSECVCLLIFPELIINKTILLNMRDLRYVMKLVKKNYFRTSPLTQVMATYFDHTC